MKKKLYKRCPRCNKKMFAVEKKCEQCGLIFERLKKATNSAGKKALAKHEENKVVYVTNLPKDVSKIKLLLFSIFFGFFGVHYAYVGRKKLFAFCFISNLYLLLYTIFYTFKLISVAFLTTGYSGLIFQFLFFPAGIANILWLVSIFQIIFNKFKVPVSIDEEYFIDPNNSEIDGAVAKEILSEVKQTRENTLKTNKKSHKRRVFCNNCGEYVKVMEGDVVCPKCDEPLKK